MFVMHIWLFLCKMRNINIKYYIIIIITIIIIIIIISYYYKYIFESFFPLNFPFPTFKLRVFICKRYDDSLKL